MAAYYNENDPYAAQWLRNLIVAGHIAPGEVDERSILDVRADDLRSFTQCHFFAGIGVWSYALRLAGWPDEREVWTGSCPCQPFSSAGRAGGFNDGRHLWPHWSRLISECRPVAVFGEQVASADGLAWFDFVSSDLEAAGYAVGAVDTCAAGFGAPHIRQRLYFVADSDGSRCGARRASEASNGTGSSRLEPARLRAACELADTDGGNASTERQQRGGEHGLKPQDGVADPLAVDDSAGARQQPAGSGTEGEARNETRLRGLERRRAEGRLEHTEGDGRIERRAEPSGRGAAGGRGEGVVGNAEIDGRERRHLREETGRPQGGNATSGFWADADWLPCIDGKARPTKSGLFPLAYGVAGRVGKLRAAGNAIVAPQAAEFIRAYMSIAITV